MAIIERQTGQNGQQQNTVQPDAARIEGLPEIARATLDRIQGLSDTGPTQPGVGISEHQR